MLVKAGAGLLFLEQYVQLFDSWHVHITQRCNAHTGTRTTDTHTLVLSLAVSGNSSTNQQFIKAIYGPIHNWINVSVLYTNTSYSEVFGLNPNRSFVDVFLGDWPFRLIIIIIQYNFIAKCQYTDCTRNVLWYQVHSSHIHSNNKTFNYNSK